MRCPSVRALLLDDISQLQNGDVQTHLSGCAECSAYVSQIEHVHQRLHTDAERINAPADAWVRLRASLERAPTPTIKPPLPLLQWLLESVHSGDSILNKPFAFSAFSGAVLLVMLAVFVGLVLMRPLSGPAVSPEETATPTVMPTEIASAIPTITVTPSATPEISTAPPSASTGMIGFTNSNHNVDAGIYFRALTADHEEVIFASPDWYPDEAVWSPDGKSLIFSGYQKEGEDPQNNFNLYIMGFPGELRVLVDRAGHDNLPAWSPDGTKIAFTGVNDAGDSFDIFVVNADGSGLTPIVTHHNADYDPEWSPDGEWLVFITDRDGDPDLYITRADGTGEPYAITFNDEVQDISPDWSPDGKWIVYASRDFNGERPSGSIYLYSLEHPEQGPILLAADVGINPSPVWSLDGTKIAYIGGNLELRTNGDLYMMNADGSEITQLTDTPTIDEQFPTWFAWGTP